MSGLNITKSDLEKGNVTFGYLMDFNTMLPFFDVNERDEYDGRVFLNVTKHTFDVCTEIDGIKRTVNTTTDELYQLIRHYRIFNKIERREPCIDLYYMTMEPILKKIKKGEVIIVTEDDKDDFFTYRRSKTGPIIKRIPKKKYVNTAVIFKDALVRKRYKF